MPVVPSVDLPERIHFQGRIRFELMRDPIRRVERVSDRSIAAEAASYNEAATRQHAIEARAARAALFCRKSLQARCLSSRCDKEHRG